MMDNAALEALGWKRLEGLLKENRDAFMQLIAGLASEGTSANSETHMSGYGVVISVGQMSDTIWKAMELVAVVVSADARAKQAVFLEVDP